MLTVRAYGVKFCRSGIAKCSPYGRMKSCFVPVELPTSSCRSHKHRYPLIAARPRVGVPDLPHPIWYCTAHRNTRHGDSAFLPALPDSALHVAFFLSGRFRLQRYERTYRQLLLSEVRRSQAGL